MSINTTKLLSGRSAVVDYGNLTADRYQFLALGQAEPNLGAGADNSILTISTNNTRVWTNSITLSSVSVSGNITGGNLLTSGLISASSNVTGGNIITGGVVSATGNVTGNFILGNGSQLTGIITSVSNVVNGDSNLNIATANANITISVSTVGNVAVFTPTGASILGNVAVSNTISATGNITTAGFFVGNFIGNISGNISAAGANTQVLFNDGGVTTTMVTMFGANNMTTIRGSTTVNTAAGATAIVNGAGNAVGNIGSSSSYFNTVFAQATTALYADVAERFASDEIYEPGTVVELGGSAEITRVRHDASDTVFGVISTRPAFTMNGGAGDNDTHPPVAMTGRVPVKVTGIVNKGDRLISAGDGMARAAQPGEATSFNVIGRALSSKSTVEVGTVEAIVTIK
jgi:hypothetical protein